jgi:hypothetical protein
MKRHLIILLSVLLTHAIGAMAEVRLLSVGSHSLGTNGTITVPVLVSDAAGVAGVDITLRFNSSILTAHSAATTPLSAAYNMQYNATIPGEIRISLARSAGAAGGSGPLVNILFDVSGAARVGDSIPLTLDVANLYDEGASPLPATASNGCFEVEDSDGSGLPDVWKQRIVAACTNGTIASIHDVKPEDDFDGDGVCNGDEYVADTDPTDPDSFLAITDIAGDGSGVHIDWQGGVWANQHLESTDDLTAGPSAWRCIRTNTPPTSVTGSATDNRPAQGRMFYRIKADR